MRYLFILLLLLVSPAPAKADTGTAVMNVSSQGSTYIYVYNGNDTTTFADLVALGNGIVGWIATMTSYSGFGSGSVGDTAFVCGVSGSGDNLFLTMCDADGNSFTPAAGSWYSFSAPAAAATPVYASTAPTTAQQTKINAKLALAASGQGDTVEAGITGSFNDVFITQAGGISYLGLIIVGNSNDVDTEQDLHSGSHGYIDATIIGDSNDIDILQKGIGNKAAVLTVTGDSNDVDIRQHGAGDKFIDLAITGDNHKADIFQNGAGAHSARVELDGEQPWDFKLEQKGAIDKDYTLPHTMSDGTGVSGTCNASGGCNLIVYQND